MNPRKVTCFTLLFTLAIVASGSTACRALASDTMPRAAIVEKICSDLERVYVLPDDAKSMADLLRANLQGGAYDNLSSLEGFAERLTQDLRSIRHDLHLEISAIGRDPSPAEEEVDHHDPEYQRRHNYGLRRVEVLDGNVGYLKLDAFIDGDDALGAGVAAMNFLAHSDALVIDLRENGGGGVGMIQLLHSYLHDGRQQLSGIYIREFDVQMQFWTQAFVSGPRLPEIPLWVLVSDRTFSAAEAFAYDMKQMGRGTIVGETTRGGAHLVRTADYPELGISARIPFARAVSPVTGGNWEGTGVQPDIPVPADKALAAAHAEALRLILSEERESGWRLMLERVLENVEDGA